MRIFFNFVKNVQNEKSMKGITIRSDNGGEFVNSEMESFCIYLGIHHDFSCARTPEQNGVIERKNRNIGVMVRTMLNAHSLRKYFRAETARTSCYILNKV